MYTLSKMTPGKDDLSDSPVRKGRPFFMSNTRPSHEKYDSAESCRDVRRIKSLGIISGATVPECTLEILIANHTGRHALNHITTSTRGVHYERPPAAFCCDLMTRFTTFASS